MKMKSVQGFSLVEMLVVISIIGIITTTVVFQHRSASDTLELNNAANTLTLELRKAQSFGLGVQKYDGFEEEDAFKAGYGVFIEKPDTIILFADHPNDGTKGEYDEEVDGEVSNITLPGGVIITEICINETDCNDGGYVVYERPSPEALICFSTCDNPADSMRVTLESPEEKEVFVLVNKSGRISIER